MKTIQVMRTIKQSHWGGIESVVIETGKRLIQQGIETKIYCSPKRSAIEDQEIMQVPLQHTSLLSPYFKESNLNLIHWHQGYRLATLVRKYALRNKIPYILSLHNGAESMQLYQEFLDKRFNLFSLQGLKQFEIGMNMHKVYGDASALLLIGQDEMKMAHEFFPHKQLIYAPNGVDCNRFAKGNGSKFRKNYNIPQDHILLTCIARIDCNKAQLTVIHALKKVHKFYSKVSLCLIGSVTDPSYYKLLKKQIKEYDLQKHVYLIPGINGYNQELVDAYHAADIFVLPSLCEPFGIVILEAWASGKPVIATNAGGIPYFVDDVINGLLFKVQDIEQLTKKILVLIENPNLRSEISLAGKTKVKKEYNWDVLTKKQIDLYAELTYRYKK